MTNLLLEQINKATDLNEAMKSELFDALQNQNQDIINKIINDDFEFCETHLHTEYSLLDGVNKINAYIERAVELGHRAMAVTDHRVTHGWFKLRSATDSGINPIFGCEVEVREKEKNYHLVLLAKNNIGYRNILTIVAWSHLNGYAKGKAAVPKEIIEQYTEGIIATSACIGGILGKYLIDEIKVAKNQNRKPDISSVKKTIREEAIYWSKLFPDRFYLEVQNYDLIEDRPLEEFEKDFIVNQNISNEILYELSDELHLPLVATNDVHYAIKGQDVVQDILLCINRKDLLDNPNRFRFSSRLHYMKSKWEMLWRFRERPEAVFNTYEIAKQCHVDYQTEYLLPGYPDIPEGISEIDFFKQRTWEGVREFYSHKKNYEPLLKKFNCSKKELWEKIKERTEYEISIFLKMGFEGYILVVSWCVEIARQNNILIGHARGSAGGSIVALGNKITDICPLRYDLLFERFLNPDRHEMPDIDIDYQYEFRKDVIKMVAKRLGEDKVAQICTFGKMMARAAIRNVGKVMDLNLQLVDKVAKYIPFNTDISKALEEVPELKQLYDTNEDVKKLIDYSILVEGKPKNYSVHAAGIILSKESLTNHVALQVGKKAILPVIQAEMGDVDGLRLVKQDFLGLRNLSIISDCIKSIKERHGITIDPYNIPKDDKETYEMLARGESVACFQLESAGMRQLLQDMKIECLEDVVDCIALFRPGVLSVGMHNEYVRNKFSPDSIKYISRSLEPILSPTKGILIYQEQAMIIANKVAGMSMSEADKLRKAISKKKEKLMEKIKVKFVEGCKVTSGLEKEVAEEIWHLIEVMAKYSFNKSHSVGYAYTSVDTAYLKCHFPIEYMAAAISRSAEAKSPKVPLYIEEAKRLGIKVLPPTINLSEEWFSIKDDDKIIFGLSAIRDVGKVGEEIIKERNENGPFTGLVDFRKRCPKVNKKALGALIKAGCFDKFGHNRYEFGAVLEEVIKIKPKVKKKENPAQLTLNIPLPDFSSINNNMDEITLRIPSITAPTKEEIAEIEDEMLGSYISFHPLAEYKEAFDKVITMSAEDLEGDVQEGQVVIMGGLIKQRNIYITKKRQEEMGKYIIDDMTGNITAISFPSTFQKMKEFKEKSIVLIKGKINFNERFGYNNNNEDDDNEEQVKEYDIQIVVDEMMAFDPHSKGYFSINNNENITNFNEYLSHENDNRDDYKAQNTQEDVKQNTQEEVQQNTNSNKLEMTLLEYLESNGSPQVVNF